MTAGDGVVSRSTTEAERARIWAIHATFFANGFILASWVSRLPAVRSHLDASEPQLGGALLAIAAGAVVAMPLTSRFCDRFGLRRVLSTAMVACTAMFVVAGITPHIVLLAAVLLLVGFGYGTWDVSMNAAAHDIEVAVDRPLMPRFHGAFSVGGLSGAGLGAARRGARPRRRSPPRRGRGSCRHHGHRRLQVLPRRDDGRRANVAVEQPRRRVITPRLVLLGLLTACTTLGEGAAADWGAIFFTDERQAEESVAAIGYAGFAGAMAIGRFSGTWVLTHISRVAALRASGLLASVSVLALVAVDSIATGLVAMIGWGLGVALVFPAAMSAGAENSVRPAQGIATVATIGYGGFLVGPPMIGFIAGAAGLDVGLFVVSVLLLLVVALAPAARSSLPDGSAPRDDVRVGVA